MTTKPTTPETGNTSTEQNIAQAAAKAVSLHRAWQPVLLMKREPLDDGQEVAQYVPAGPLYAFAVDAMGYAHEAMKERSDVIAVTAHAVFTTTKVDAPSDNIKALAPER